MSETIRFVTGEADLAACRALRHTVFVEEQGVSVADEIDGLDPDCLHLLARQDGVPVGAARVLIRDGVAKIGRVCVLPDRRGTGLGARMLDAMLSHLGTLPEVTKAKLGSQIAAMSLYSRAGFRPVGERYLDAGMPHQDMERPVRD